MSVVTTREFLSRWLHPLNSRRALLGLDVGDVATGVAVTTVDNSRPRSQQPDQLGRLIASPLCTVRRPKFRHDRVASAAERTEYARVYSDEVAALIKEYKVGGLVVGWPLEQHGGEGPRCEATLAFIDGLRTHAGVFLPTVLWDERYTSGGARQALKADGVMARGRLKKDIVNSTAAALVLQDFLNRIDAAMP